MMTNHASGERMRAAVLTAPGRCELREVERPVAGPGQARVRLEGCGICGSNLPLWEGRPWLQYPTQPGAPGHEGWGVVDQIGPGVDSKLLGQRVAALSYHAYAEYDVADAAHLVELPSALDGEPFPGEALGCAMNIFQRSGIELGQTVAIVGAGFLGVLLVQLATHAGARVIAISRRAFAREKAEEAGAWKLIPMLDHAEIVRQVMNYTDDRGCDCVIEAVGEQWPLDLAGELCGERARLIVAGYHQDPRQVNMQLWNWRGIDVINAHERAPSAYVRGIRSAVEAVSQGVIQPGPLYTHSFPLSELAAGLEALKTRPDGLLKGWVKL
jgi:threonine dehydrogenase-like Zn-dependent dehydrogenase